MQDFGIEDMEFSQLLAMVLAQNSPVGDWRIDVIHDLRRKVLGYSFANQSFETTFSGEISEFLEKTETPVDCCQSAERIDELLRRFSTWMGE